MFPLHLYAIGGEARLLSFKTMQNQHAEKTMGFVMKLCTESSILHRTGKHENRPQHVSFAYCRQAENALASVGTPTASMFRSSSLKITS